MSERASAIVNWTPADEEEDYAFFSLTDDLRPFRGFHLWEGMVAGSAYLNILTPTTPGDGLCAPIAVVDELCQKWLEARGWTVTQPQEKTV